MQSLKLQPEKYVVALEIYYHLQNSINTRNKSRIRNIFSSSAKNAKYIRNSTDESNFFSTDIKSCLRRLSLPLIVIDILFCRVPLGCLHNVHGG